jgi:hypothetical protein
MNKMALGKIQNLSVTKPGRATHMDGGRSSGLKAHTMKQSFLNKRRKKMRDSSHGSEKHEDRVKREARKK